MPLHGKAIENLGALMRLLLTTSDLDDMPEEPVPRFLRIYEVVTERYENQLSIMDAKDSWSNVEDVRRQYASVLSASAKRLGIEELAKIKLPPADDYKLFENFVHEVDHYVLQMMHDASISRSKTSIELRGDLKARLRTLSQHMRECVERMDLIESRKQALLHRITEFERELEKRRMTVTTAALLAVHIIVGVKEGGEEGAQLIALSQKVMEAFAHEKGQQDKERLDRVPDYRDQPPRQLTGTGNLLLAESGPGESFLADLDDDIPF